MAALSRSCLVLLALHSALFSYNCLPSSNDGDDENGIVSGQQSLHQVFSIEGKISVSDDKLKGGR